MNKVLAFTLKVNGGKGLVKTLAELEAELSYVNKQYNLTKKAVNIFLEGTDKQIKALKKTGVIYTQVSSDLEKYKKSQLNLKEAIRLTSQPFKDRIKDLKATERAEKKQIQINKLSSTSLIARVAEYKKLRKELDALSTSALKSSKNILKVAKAGRLKFQIDQYTSGLKDNFSNVGNYKSALLGLSGTLKKGILQMAGFTSAAFVLQKGLSSVFNTVKDFEEEQAVLSAILGESGEAMSSLADEALRLGATTVFTAKQVTELETELARLGFNSDEILDATESIIAFSVATKSQVPQAAALAGAAVRSFNLDASEMERVVNVMGVSTTKSALTFAKLNTAIPKASAVAKIYGFTIEQLTAKMGILANSGVEASIIGTSLRNIFIKLAKHGLTWDEAMQKIATSTDKTTTATELFDVRTATSAVLLAENTVEADNLQASLEGLTDELQIMADKQLDTIAGKLLLLTSAWQGLILSFDSGDGALTKGVSGLLEGFTSILNYLTEINTQPISDSIIQGRNELENYLNVLVNNKDNLGIQKQVITDLNNKYPSYLKNLDLEKIGLEDIADVLGNYDSKNKFRLENSIVEVKTNKLLSEQVRLRKIIIDLAVQQENNEKNNNSVQKYFGGKAIEQYKEQLEEVDQKLEEIRSRPVVVNVEMDNLLNSQDELGRQIIDINDQINSGTAKDVDSLNDKLTTTVKKYEETKNRINEINSKLFIKNKPDKQSDVGSLEKELNEQQSALKTQIVDLNLREGVKNVDLIKQLIADYKDVTKRLEKARSFSKKPKTVKGKTQKQIDAINLKAELASIKEIRDLKIVEAQEYIKDAETQAAEISRIKLEYELKLIAKKKELNKDPNKSDASYDVKYNETLNKNAEAEIKIRFIEQGNIIDETERIRTQISRETVDDEKQLQAELSLIRSDSIIAHLQNQLENTTLSTSERLRLEEKLIQEKDALNIKVAKDHINYEERLDTISNDTLKQLYEILPDLENINSESLEKLREYGERKSIIILEQLIKEKDLEIEAKSLAGNDVEELVFAQHERELSLDKLKNKTKIDNADKASKEISKIVSDSLKTQETAIHDISKAMGSYLVDMTKDTDAAGATLVKSMGLIMIDLIGQQLTLMATTAFAQPDSVASFGATGLTRVAIITALIKGATAGLKASIGKLAEGDLLNGNIFNGPSHAHGGVKFRYGNNIAEAEGGEAIIKKKSTKKWHGLLSAINEDEGGKKFSSSSYRYKPMLAQLKKRGIFAEGGTLVGPRIAPVIPQISNPQNIIINTIIDPKDITNLGETLSKVNIDTLTPIVQQIAEQVVIGLDKDTRLKDRQKIAEENGLI